MQRKKEQAQSQSKKAAKWLKIKVQIISGKILEA